MNNNPWKTKCLLRNLSKKKSGRDGNETIFDVENKLLKYVKDPVENDKIVPIRKERKQKYALK